MNKFILILICLFSLTSKIAYAEQSYFSEHEKGWHWYDDPKEDDDIEEDEIVSSSDPIDQMSVLHETVKRALDKAILNPSKENVKNYIALQQKVTDQSQKFAMTWKEVLVENPELDFSLKHPTNNAAKMIESDQTKEMEQRAIQQLASKSGLFFFYRSSCPYCRAFAPILKQFAEENKIKVIPITTDGISLPEFPDSYTDQGQSKKFNVTVEPALFAVNPYTQKAFPVTYGMISIDDLKKRILDIATKFGGNDE